MTRTPEDLRRECKARRGGFILEGDLPEIIAACRRQLLLIRHSHGRMLAPAQDVPHVLQLIANWPGAYVRDVSWPAALEATLTLDGFITDHTRANGEK